MQQEFDAMDPQPGIQLLGSNPAGNESGNELASTDRDLPWLQETSTYPVRNLWAVTFRDVVILDGANEKTGVFNLSSGNLSVQANYDSLRTLLLNAAN